MEGAEKMKEFRGNPGYDELVSKSEKLISRAFGRYTQIPVERGEGVYLFDTAGNRYIDFTAGIATCNVGHCHPEVVSAIKEQAEKIIHLMDHVGYYRPYIDLVERVNSLLPAGFSDAAAFLVNGGSEAVEVAMKLARMVTGRPVVLSFFGAFHGRTMGALSVTASNMVYKVGLGGLFPAVHHVPFPYDPEGKQKDLTSECIGFIKMLLKTAVHPDDVAAIIVEPVQGESGYRIPPDDFLPELRALCDEYGFLLIFDEIQTGFGRTGKMFALEHWEVEPDIICLAKAFGGGLPLSGMFAKQELNQKWRPAAHGSTFGGNPLAIAASLASIEVILKENLVENSRKMGEYLVDLVKEAQENTSAIGSVRGLGLMIAVDIVDREGKPFENCKDILYSAAERGLVLSTCGTNSIRICPPLTINRSQVEEGVQILVDSIKDVTG